MNAIRNYSNTYASFDFSMFTEIFTYVALKKTIAAESQNFAKSSHF